MERTASSLWQRLLALVVCFVYCNWLVLSVVSGKKINYKQIDATIGETVRLECFHANDNLTIEWWKGGVSVKSTRRISLRRRGEILKIKSIMLDDFGMYNCKDKATSKVLGSLRLMNKAATDGTVLLKPVFVDPLKMKRASYNVRPAYGSLRLPCMAKSSNPPIIYTWYKNGKIFTERRLDQKLVYNASVLRLKHLVPSDIGNYTCVASNHFGSISYRFDVTVLPTIRSQPVLRKENPDNFTRVVGSNVSLSCVELISGTLPDFRWVHWRIFPTDELLQKTIKSEQILNESVATLIDPSHHRPIRRRSESGTRYGVQLQLYNITEDDSGWYSCIVSNHIGTDYLVATLRVVSQLAKAPLKKAEGQSIKELLVIVLGVTVGVIAIGLFVVLRELRKRKRKEKIAELKKQKRQLSSSAVAYHGDCFELNDKLGRAPLPLSWSSNGSVSVLRRGASIRSGSEYGPPCSLQSHFPYCPAGMREKFEMAYDEAWEIDRGSLHLGEVLGEGAFGIVVKADVYGLPDMPYKSTVAVKMLRANATDNDCDDLLSEMKTMKSIKKHLNIINFLGHSTQNGELLVVVEYAPHGNLRQYLRSKRPTAEMLAQERTEPLLSLSDLVSAALQIARGMQYLVLQKCIHRDLAARNVLVGDDYIMKIADFGLARSVHDADYYKKTTDGRLPVKWLAIEALFDRVYTTQSDVWAFGVLLWEIFTLGGSPYPGVPVQKLFDLLKRQFRMEKPQGCPVEIYQIMCKCWYEDPNCRPTFDELVEGLSELLENFASSDYVKMLSHSLSTIAETDSSCESDELRLRAADEHPSDCDDDDDDDERHHLRRLVTTVPDGDQPILVADCTTADSKSRNQRSNNHLAVRDDETVDLIESVF